MRIRDRDVVSALEKGLVVIEALGAAESGFTLSAVARDTGLTRAAVRRYLLTLVKLGYAEFNGRRFALTPHVLRLGSAYFSSAPLPRLAQPFLERIGERTHEVASLGVLDGTDVVFLGHSTRRHILSASTGVGTRTPAYCTAMGRVLLAGLGDTEVERFLKGNRLKKLTPNTKTGLREIMHEIDKVRRQGYAINDEELEIGLRSIAVPVSNSRGQTVLAISVSLQAARMTPAQLVERVLSALQSAKRELAAIL